MWINLSVIYQYRAYIFVDDLQATPLFSEDDYHIIIKHSNRMSDPITKLLDNIDKIKTDIKLKDALISEMYLHHVEERQVSWK